MRAIWDEEKSKWWFSAIDVIRAINDEADYVKAGNYWCWLKKKFTTDGTQLVSVTHEFKFEAPDGKKRAAEAEEFLDGPTPTSTPTSIIPENENIKGLK